MVFWNRLWENIRIWAAYLAYGMKAADNEIMGPSSIKSDGEGTSINVQHEKASVFKDLLRGEVTERVKELRHEMYYAERASSGYEYAGNGTAKKKEEVCMDFNDVENSEGSKILLVQKNRQILDNIYDCVNPENSRKYTIKINRNFRPRFFIEQYTRLLVVKERDGGVQLDFYLPSYRSQFDRNQRYLINELEEIEKGKAFSDLLEMSDAGFVTFGAAGAPDFIMYTYNNIKYKGIAKFNGEYILKFDAEAETDGEDLVAEFYHEETAKKCENHEMREGAAVNLLVAMEALKEKEKFDADEAARLIEDFKENGR